MASSHDSDMVCFLRPARPKREHKISQDADCQFTFHARSIAARFRIPRKEVSRFP